MAAVVAACGPAPLTQGINDPDEAANRRAHEFNRKLDRGLVRPVALGYGRVVPKPVQQGVTNFSANLDLPGDVLNSLLQARLEPAISNTLRFALNTTVGIGGLFDPATALGLPQNETDFGETLYVWGFGEGIYTEVPAWGSTTQRDLYGTVFDVALNPTRLIPSPESYYVTGARVGSLLGERARYSDTLDSVLYDSADSYAQTRLLYLQNRRFELGQTGSAEDDFIDPYAIDPYEDSNAE